MHPCPQAPYTDLVIRADWGTFWEPADSWTSKPNYSPLGDARTGPGNWVRHVELAKQFCSYDCVRTSVLDVEPIVHDSADTYRVVGTKSTVEMRAGADSVDHGGAEPPPGADVPMADADDDDITGGLEAPDFFSLLVGPPCDKDEAPMSAASADPEHEPAVAAATADAARAAMAAGCESAVDDLDIEPHTDWFKALRG